MIENVMYFMFSFSIKIFFIYFSVSEIQCCFVKTKVSHFCHFEKSGRVCIKYIHKRSMDVIIVTICHTICLKFIIAFIPVELAK